SPFIVVLSAAIITSLSLVAWDQVDQPVPAALMTFVVVTAFLGLLCYVLRIIYRVTDKGGILGFVIIAITWATPIVVDLALWQLGPSLKDFEPSAISACSPPAALTMIWDQPSRPPPSPDEEPPDLRSQLLIGIGFQVTLAAGSALLFYAGSNKKRSQTNHE